MKKTRRKEEEKKEVMSSLSKQSSHFKINIFKNKELEWP